MSPVMKNITYVLLALTIIAAGYYFYNRSDTSSLDTGSNTVLTQEILVSTQLFIERRALLEDVRLNVDTFNNPNFISYRSFREPFREEPYGVRPNPFVPVGQQGL